MNIGIVGLGLIGGSLAKALRQKTDHHLLGFDQDQAVLDRALAEGVVAEALTDDALPRCDILLLAVRPQAIIQWLTDHAPRLSRHTVVLDCAGTKAKVCAAGQALARQWGFTFVGGHPMAGTEKMGYAASRPNLFDGASMLVVPGEDYPPRVRTMVEALCREIGFGGVKYTTAQEHDRTIAYTSQLAHVVSSAYIKSPTAQNYVGFSAGSFKDMTRVAFLNEPMWTELFLENRENLLRELRELQGHLSDYIQALEANDWDALEGLLREGRTLKVLSDNREV